MSSAESATDAPQHLSSIELCTLAAASAVVTANAYYIHPIIARVAEDFGVSAAMIGIVPASNQIALALGIFLVLPLGDWISNRRLTTVLVIAQTIAIAGMAFAEDFRLFVAASTILGFFTVAPYLIPAYVSKRVPPEKLGHATALLTTGVIGGILVARVGAGFIGEYYGWRVVYMLAASLMAVISILLPMIMRERADKEDERGEQDYISLLTSILPIVRAHPRVLLSGVIQGMNFGIFLAVWMGLGLHLTSDAMGYGTDVVGYLAIFSILNLGTTPWLGSWADRAGAQRARVIMAAVQFSGVVMLMFFGNSLWLLMIPIVIMNLVGPVIDITGRMTFLSLAPEIRTRLMTVYIVLMFIGGGIISWAATAAYDFGGWHGNAALALVLSTLVLTLSFFSQRGAGPR